MNLLLVDDDKIFIRKTIKGIDWESIGIQRGFTAENMEQACKVLETLAKLFRTQTGRSISGYVMERRMELAKEYLADTHKPISESALMAGYSNFSYFSKSFRDYAGN